MDLLEHQGKKLFAAAGLPGLANAVAVTPAEAVEATRRIVQAQPGCAILVVTATVEGHLSRVFDAMGAGALDAVNTPVLGTDGQVHGGAELLRKIAIVGRLATRAGMASVASVV